MILSVSRRTDIPAFYMDWFMRRLRDGEVWVRNPVNPRQISRVSLERPHVDGIVFWSKSPAPMINYAEELRSWPWYLQFTLTGYGKDIEPRLPDKRRTLIPLFQKLAEIFGGERLVWRYDPILITDRYSLSYHEKAFRSIAEELKGCTGEAVISFLDLYGKTRRNMAGTGLQDISQKDMKSLAEAMAAAARENGMRAVSCAEPLTENWTGVERGACIAQARLEALCGCRLKAKKDKGQRETCGCMESIDVGAYDTCLLGCRYCYANAGWDQAKKKAELYRPDSLLLCSEMESRDSLSIRKGRTLRL